MEILKSLSEIFQYAERHNISSLAIITALGVFFIAWIGRKGGGKAINIVGGVLEAADKMLESMQKRHDMLQSALERSERLNERLKERNVKLEDDLRTCENNLSESHADCRDCRNKLRNLAG